MATLLRAVLLLLSFAGPAAATTLSWVHVGNGNASTASNWSPAQMPAAGDVLVFNLSGSRTITFDSSVPASTQHVYRTGTNSLSFSAPHVVSGNVLAGTVEFRIGGRTEIYTAGDAYCVPPGHVPIHHDGAQIVEFSPTELLGETIGVVMANLERGRRPVRLAAGR